MKNAFADVLRFHQACDVPFHATPQFPPEERRKLRDDLIDEEYKEYKVAREANDLPGLADAIGDLIYVLIGTALEHGIPLPEVWAAIQNANMAKVDPATGKVRRREDGKILKPEGWTAPDILAILIEANYHA